MMIKCKVTNTTEGPVFFKWVKPAINLEGKSSTVVDYDPFSVVDHKTKPLLMADLELKRCALEYQLDLGTMNGLPITVSVTNTAALEKEEALKKEEPKKEEPKKEEPKKEEPKKEEDPFKSGGIKEGTMEDAKPAAEPLLGEWGGGGPTRKDVPVVDIWDGKTEDEKAKAEAEKKAQEEAAAKAKAKAEAEKKAQEEAAAKAKAKAEAEKKAREEEEAKKKAEAKKKEEAKSKKGKDKKKADAKKKKPELFGDNDDAGDTLL